MAPQADQLRWTAAQRPEQVAYLQLASGDQITFGQWDDTADRIARMLGSYGVGRGDRVALHLEGSHLRQWLASPPGIHRAGAVAVPTNTRLSTRELTGILRHAEPVVAITGGELTSMVREVAAEVDSLRVVLDAGGAEWDELLDAQQAGPPNVVVDDDDLAEIMYTSGTTGLPKGVAVRHRNTALIPNGEPPWSGDAWLHASPLFTFAGMSFLYNPMKMGMTALYLPRFDVDAWFDAVATRRPTCVFLVPAMAQLLVQSARWADADLSSLTLVSMGSAPLPPSLHLAVADRLPEATVSNSYSMTEVGSAFTFLPPGELRRRIGSVGIPMGTEIRIVDDSDESLPPGAVGEVMVRVGRHHREYYRDPVATEATWTGEWVRSGDLGELDADGYLYIRGRKKDVIIRGGNNIVATDVESVLYEHPDVAEAAVVPVPHDVLGEDVGAAVVVRDGVERTAAEADALLAHCRERLADYKVPRHLWFLDALPRNATGKVTKRDIEVPAQVWS